jgi:hypothetical protein
MWISFVGGAILLAGKPGVVAVLKGGPGFGLIYIKDFWCFILHTTVPYRTVACVSFLFNFSVKGGVYEAFQ